MDNRESIVGVNAELFGSLGQTGIGHGSDIAVILGLAGYEPDKIDSEQVASILKEIDEQQGISMSGIGFIPLIEPRVLYCISVKRCLITAMR